MRVTSTSPPSKKRKIVHLQDISACEDAGGRSRAAKQEDSDEDFSPGSGTPEDNDDEDGDDNDDFQEYSAPVEQLHERGAVLLLKPVFVDVNGNPYGPMKATLADDVRKMAKELDPSSSWEGQPNHDRRRLFTRLYTGGNSIN